MHMKPIIVLALAIVHNAASAAIVLFLPLCHVEQQSNPIRRAYCEEKAE